MSFKALEEYIESLYADKGIGMSDLIVMKDNEVIFRKFAGYKRPEKKVPMQGDEWYNIYSCTKMTTCVATMQLIERGLIKLDDPLYKFIPEFEEMYLKNGEKAKRPITIFHLMSMRSGLDYELLDESMKKAVENKKATTLDCIRAMANKKLLFHPGESYQYSLSHDVLAGVIEVVTGESFGDYVEKNIFAPLGMKNIKFTYEESEKDKFASQFLYNEDGSFTDLELYNDYKLTDNYQSGGAGLIASVEEYAKLPSALANGGVGATGNRILKPESIEKFKMDTMHIATREEMHEKGYSYGLGFRTLVSKNYTQKSPIGEFGWDGAMGCYYFIDTDNHLSCFYGTHMASDHGFIYTEVHPKLRNMIYEALEL